VTSYLGIVNSLLDFRKVRQAAPINRTRAHRGYASDQRRLAPLRDT
jgi:hypothetical protein